MRERQQEGRLGLFLRTLGLPLGHHGEGNGMGECQKTAGSR